ncbi:MAG: hypothetical protein ACNA7U_01205 [Candidatus Izemoplasmataceae bacterium]
MGSITKSGITFNGVSSVGMGVVIQTPPVYEFPAKRYELIQIQGKNGDILIDTNAYNNVNRQYNIASALPDGNFINKVRQIVDWLSSVSGYARLEDSYEPDYYRLAMFRSGGQLQNIFNKATGMVVTFECKPQRFLKSGDIPVVLNLNTWYELKNEQSYISLPEISINATNFVITIEYGETPEDSGNLKTVISIDGDSGNAKIDSELEDCYNNSGYLNNKISISNGFPKLYPGRNWIKIESDEFVSASIKPRWWVL